MRFDVERLEGEWRLAQQERAGRPVAEFRSGGRRVTRRVLVECASRVEGAAWVERENRARKDARDPAARAALASRQRNWVDAASAFQERSAARLRAGEIVAVTYDFLAGLADRISLYWDAKTWLSDIDAAECERLKARMRAAGLGDSTISKSFVQVIRPVLREERRLGNYVHDPAVICGDVDPKYKPGTRYATVEQAWAIVKSFERLRDGKGEATEQSRRIAWAFGTGARLAETRRAEWQDLEVRDVDGVGVATIRIRGTKTAKSDRYYPVTRTVAAFVDYAYEGRGDKSGPMFGEWTSMHNRLRGNGRKVGAGPLSPNDLRRSTITWLCWAGVPEASVAGWMGNSAEMVRKVYAQWTPERKADAAARSALDFVDRAPAPVRGPEGGAKVIDMASRKRRRKTA